MIEPLKTTTMILSVTVETNRKRPYDVGTRLINAEYWHSATTVETTKTQFLYPLNYRDRRESPALLKTTNAIATIRTAANLAPTTAAITLPVHPDKDVNQSTVNTDFRTKDIVWGKPFATDPTNKSRVYILVGGFHINEYVVDLTLAEIVALVTA